MVTAKKTNTDLSTVMEKMPYGCYIVGSHDANGEANGMMADWVMQVSFVPRMVAAVFENDAHTLANIRANRSFTVNLLPRDDAGWHLAARFAQPYEGSKVFGRSLSGRQQLHHKLEGVPFRVSDTGSPVLDGACAWLECEATDFLPAGDHTLVSGLVVDGGRVSDNEVLTSEYAGWSYSG